ncbi:MAG TPA: DUF6515 family protein [Mariprofundaceae bacterium]|nr:DUF6515 family protein [Mariprofundaceae bacterium]
MKMLQSGILVLTLAMLIGGPAAGWAAERDGGRDGRHGSAHAVQSQDRGDRGGERRNSMERTERSAPAVHNGRSMERRDGVRRSERSPRAVETRDRNVRRVTQPARMERSAPATRRPAPVTRRPAPVVRRDVDRNRRPGFVLDRRYHHDRYYPPRGHIERRLPRGYLTLHHHGDPYYFWDGIWYSRSGLGFIVVAPPFGIVVPVLPPYYTTVWVGGIPYYYAGGAYYVWQPARQGYVVTEPPAESSVVTQSQNAEQFYVYPKNGQSTEQQAQDRYECHRWAVDQTGFDPSQPAADLTASQRVSKRADYRRAISACLDARGYSVK